MKLVAALLTGLVCATAAAQVPQSIVFERRGGVERQHVDFGDGYVTLPSHSVLSIEPHGGYMFAIAGTVRPPNTTTQWLRFRFSSERLFTADDWSHVAIVLRWQGTAQWNRGHGLILGRVWRQEVAATCPTDWHRAQFETWWLRPGEQQINVVYGNCGLPMFDRLVYSVLIHVADGGHVSAWITDDSTGATMFSRYVHAVENEERSRIDQFTGLAFALVASRHDAYRVRFDGIATGWF